MKKQLRSLGMTIAKAIVAKTMYPVSSGGWIPLINESYMGAFQADVQVTAQNALTHPTVYACVTQIASDIGKLSLRHTENKKNEIWTVIEKSKYSNLLKKPNKFQTRQKFIESWVLSELIHGNSYILKQRDNTGVVVALYVLDPLKVTPMVADNGDVFYQLKTDNLATLYQNIEAAPASEIIHDTMECLFHPLIGLPPLYAASLATLQGLNIQTASSSFFANKCQPGGVLTAPGKIEQPTADRIKEYWQENFTGDRTGKLAVLGDGLSYEPLAVNASDSQLIEQLGWSDEKICSVYKVPPYKVHVGDMPTYQKSEVLDRKYYSDCLQRLIESIEILLALGLGLPDKQGMEFNLEDLMRMDMSLKMTTAAEGVKGGIYSPDEARSKFNLAPVKGGDTPYLQQQNYSLAALAERDKMNPLAPAPAPAPAPEPQEPDETDKALYLLHKKSIQEVVTHEC